MRVSLGGNTCDTRIVKRPSHQSKRCFGCIAMTTKLLKDAPARFDRAIGLRRPFEPDGTNEGISRLAWRFGKNHVPNPPAS